MTSKINCSFRYKYIIIIMVVLIVCCTYLMMRKSLFLKLDKHDYISMECRIGYEFRTNDLEKISYIVDFFNANTFYRTFKCVDTLSSPEIIMILEKKDGELEPIEIYGGAWEGGLYLLYNENQYKIKNPDKFYKNIKTIFQA